MAEFRMSYQDARDLPASVRARECCVFFGAPYAAISLGIYGSEVRRLGHKNGLLPAGCLNQDWPGPMIVWYPEGDWLQRANQCPHESGYSYRRELNGNHGA